MDKLIAENAMLRVFISLTCNWGLHVSQVHTFRLVHYRFVSLLLRGQADRVDTFLVSRSSSCWPLDDESTLSHFAACTHFSSASSFAKKSHNLIAPFNLSADRGFLTENVIRKYQTLLSWSTYQHRFPNYLVAYFYFIFSPKQLYNPGNAYRSKSIQKRWGYSVNKARYLKNGLRPCNATLDATLDCEQKEKVSHWDWLPFKALDGRTKSFPIFQTAN